MTCPSTGLRRRSRRPRLRSAAAAHGDSVTCKAYPAFREHAAEDPACPGREPLLRARSRGREQKRQWPSGQPRPRHPAHTIALPGRHLSAAL